MRSHNTQVDTGVSKAAHRAHIAHHVPGRLRLRIPGAKQNLEFLQQVESAVVRLPDVHRVDVRPSTGSVVIEYQPNDPVAFVQRTIDVVAESGLLAFASPGFAEAERLLAALEEDAEFLAEHSLAARSLIDLLKDLNQHVKGATHNLLDLRLLLPVGLGVYSSVFIKKNQPSPLWVTLLIFSINSFVNLHQPPLEVVTSDVDTQISPSKLHQAS